MNDIIDCYDFYANSAIAVNTFLRSIFGAVSPLFAGKMYGKLGVAWATSLLAFVCVCVVHTSTDLVLQVRRQDTGEVEVYADGLRLAVGAAETPG